MKFNYLFKCITTHPIKHLPVGSIIYVLEDNPNVPMYWVTDGNGNEFYVGKKNIEKVEDDEN